MSPRRSTTSSPLSEPFWSRAARRRLLRCYRSASLIVALLPISGQKIINSTTSEHPRPQQRHNRKRFQHAARLLRCYRSASLIVASLPISGQKIINSTTSEHPRPQQRHNRKRFQHAGPIVALLPIASPIVASLPISGQKIINSTTSEHPRPQQRHNRKRFQHAAPQSPGPLARPVRTQTPQHKTYERTESGKAHNT